MSKNTPKVTSKKYNLDIKFAHMFVLHVNKLQQNGSDLKVKTCNIDCILKMLHAYFATTPYLKNNLQMLQ